MSEQKQMTDEEVAEAIREAHDSRGSWLDALAKARQLLSTPNGCAWVRTSERLPSGYMGTVVSYGGGTVFSYYSEGDQSESPYWGDHNGKKMPSPDYWLDYPDPPKVDREEEAFERAKNKTLGPFPTISSTLLKDFLTEYQKELK